MKIATPFFSLRGPDCIRSFRWFAAFLVVLSSSLLALAAQERTSCKKSYDDTVKMLDDDFDRTIASIKKNGRLNRMDVSDVLARMREQHQAALERQKGLYDDCLKRAAAADAAAGTEIDNETNAIQEETNKMMRNRRTLAKSGDPRFLKSKKEEISKEAAELDNRALAAVTRGDYKQARAYTRKAQALRSQAQQLGFVAEELQTANHNNAKDDADGMAKQVGLRQPDEESKPQTGEGDPFLRELRAMIAKQESLLTTELKNVQAIASKWTQDVLGEKISDLRKRVAVTEQKAHTLNDAETVFEMLKVAALGKQLAEAYEDIKAAREANAPERPRAVGKAADDVIGFVNTAAVGSEAVSVATASAGYLLPLIREFELHTIENVGQKIEGQMLAAEQSASSKSERPAGASMGFLPTLPTVATLIDRNAGVAMANTSLEPERNSGSRPSLEPTLVDGMLVKLQGTNRFSKSVGDPTLNTINRLLDGVPKPPGVEAQGRNK